MNFNYELEIESGKTETEPEKLVMKLTFGILTKVYIIIPTGHAGLAHLKIMYHESQLYPLPPSTEYHGDGNEISFEDRQPIFINPYELKAIGWNTDDTYAHSFLMNFTITLPETLGIPAVAPDVLEIVRNIIGAELIIPPAIPPVIPVIPPLKQGLIIMSKPPYAKIFIDEVDTDKLTKEKIELTVGDYTIGLELADYESWERLVSVKEGEFKEIRAELVKVPVVLPPVVPPPAVQGIYLTSSPSKAKIFIEGVDTLKLTSEKLPLDVGGYLVSLTKEGYEDWSDLFGVVEGEFKEVHAKMTKEPGYVPPKERQGLIIMSTPSYAHILINDIDTGKLTKEKLSFPTGDYLIKITRDDYEDWFGHITVKSDVFSEVHAYLTKIGEPPPEEPGEPPPEVPPPEIPAPSYPDIKWIAATENRVEIVWYPTSNEYFNHYKVYRDDVILAITTEPEFVDWDIETGRTYQYRLTEVDSWGRESWKTHGGYVTPAKYVIPEKPVDKAWVIVSGSPVYSTVQVEVGGSMYTTRLEPEKIFIPIDLNKHYGVKVTKSGYEDFEEWVIADTYSDTQIVHFDLKGMDT